MHPVVFTLATFPDDALTEALNYWPILHGIAGGLLLLAIQWLWKNAIPQIMYHLRRDEPTLARKWRTNFTEDGVEYHETVELRQRGRVVSGTIALSKNDGGEVLIYKFDGRFRHLMLSAVYYSSDSSSYEHGSFTLQYINIDGKQKLLGHYIFLSTRSTLETSPYTWTPSN